MATNKSIEKKLDEGRQYRGIDLQSFEHRKEEDGKMVVEGYATTFDTLYTLYDSPDYIVRERIDPHAFDDCEMDDVIMQYDHEGRVFARISNGTLQVEPDEKGLHTRAELSGTEIGRQLYEEIDGGYTTKMSFGFRVSEDNREVIEDHETGKVTVIRTVTKVQRLFDVSAVSLPVNDATNISARSFSEGAIAEALEEIETRRARERQKKKIKLLAEMED